ncbi:MAG: hypothetical protein ACK4KT_08645 [Thermaurantimonas sp.]
MAHIRLVAAALLLLIVFPLHAQNDRLSQKARNRMESMRIGIITSKLNLKPDEAEKFWPLYNEYRKKLDKILADRMQLIESRYLPEDSISNISDAEAEKILGSILKLNNEYAQTQSEYYNRFRKLIGTKRTLDLYLAEVQFKRAIVRELRENPVGKQE